MAKFASGSTVVTGLIGFAVLFGLAFWWFQQHAFYEETVADSVVIAGETYPVTQWRGVRSDSSPLKLRACFLLQEEVQAPPAFEAEPLVGPGWFKCFSAETIAKALAEDYAKAYVAARNEPEGFDRIVVIFPGGRSYMWRQLAQPGL